MYNFRVNGLRSWDRRGVRLWLGRTCLIGKDNLKIFKLILTIFILSIPTIIIFLVLYLIGGKKTEIVPIIFFCIWMLHYSQRTFIFPFLIKAKQPMPVAIVSFGLIFNGINTYLQARWIYTFSPSYPLSWILSPSFIIGLIIFFTGFIINLHSDRIIRHLRKPGETEYKIPY